MNKEIKQEIQNEIEPGEGIKILQLIGVKIALIIGGIFIIPAVFCGNFSYILKEEGDFILSIIFTVLGAFFWGIRIETKSR